MKTTPLHAPRLPVILAATILAAAVLGSTVDVAAEAPAARFEITVIQAKSGPPYLNPELKPLWSTLKKTFGDKYAHYQKVTARSGIVADGEALSVPLPDGTVFKATYTGVTDKKRLLRVHLAFGEFRTKVRIHDGGVFFQAGRKFEDGTLVIAVSASRVGRR